MNISSNPNLKKSDLIAVLKLILYLYLFFLSLELMGEGMKLFGKGFSQMLIETTTNPFVGLFIGILSTSIVQSSSSTTSMVVAMVASGAFSQDPEISIKLAIPIVMGANIGTSITNILVSLPQIRRDNEFKRAFSAAIVHDFFNILCVIVFFPIQLATNFLGFLSTELELIFRGVGGLSLLSPVKIVTKPVAILIEKQISLVIDNHIIIGWIVVIMAILILFFALMSIVEVLKSIVIEKAKAWFDNYLFKNTLRAFSIGILLTVLVQSSSITTSLVVPMAGAGILTISQIFPYTLGANIGTTITAILAALVTGSEAAVIVAFSHLIFNISGTMVFLPLKRIPITLAEKFAEYSIRSKIIPIAYIIFVFFIVPLFFIFIFR